MPQPVSDVLAGVQHAHERDADPGRQHAEAGVQHELDGELKLNAGKREERVAAERRAADRVRGDRAEHDQPERPGLEVAQDQLEREEHAGDRRVERRRDPAGGAARDEQPQLRLRAPARAGRVTEPSAEPICTIGPSRPTEPPEPMHTADASDFTIGTCGRIRPPSRLTAYITSGTPCPRASGAKRLTSGP